eukprot:CCRYP_007861-RA/>CCRYP_007861-RA protein AED:0.12 eAED:1.00 QI:0/-1/0/1/-1/0/1/0/105
MLRLSAQSKQSLTWPKFLWLMFLFIGLKEELTTWPCGGSRSSMLPGFATAYLAKLLGLLHWNCSQKPRQIIGIYFIPMSGDVLSSCLTLSYRMGRVLPWPVHGFL